MSTPRTFHRLVQTAAVVVLPCLAATASADVVVMKTGSRLACQRAVAEEGRYRIELSTGGVLHVALEDVKRVDVGSAAGPRAGVMTASSATGSSGSSPSGTPGKRNYDLGAIDPLIESEEGVVNSESVGRKAAAQGRASRMPTAIGAMAGIEPVPTAEELRAGDGRPPMDARRQALADRARIPVGGDGNSLVSRYNRGRDAPRGDRDGASMRGAPRLPR